MSSARAHAACLLAAWALSLEMAPCAAAYLRDVGPEPLRFEPRRRHVMLVSALPHLEIREPAAAGQQPPAQAGTTNHFTEAPASASDGPAAPAASAATAAAMSPAASEALPAVTPQRLLDYLRPALGTNINATAMPEFIPPAPPSSSATYRTK